LAPAVKAGELLAEIDTPEVDQQLQQARSDLDTAEANLHLARITATRYKDLMKSDSVAQQMLTMRPGTSKRADGRRIGRV